MRSWYETSLGIPAWANASSWSSSGVTGSVSSTFERRVSYWDGGSAGYQSISIDYYTTGGVDTDKTTTHGWATGSTSWDADLNSEQSYEAEMSRVASWGTVSTYNNVDNYTYYGGGDSANVEGYTEFITDIVGVASTQSISTMSGYTPNLRSFYVSGYDPTVDVVGRITTTDISTECSHIVSTDNSGSTTTTEVSYSTITITTTGYITSTFGAVGDYSLKGYGHRYPVSSAEYNEYLIYQTASGDSMEAASALLAPETYALVSASITFGSELSTQYSDGLADGFLYTTTVNSDRPTLTISVISQNTYTYRINDGWVGGSDTRTDVDSILTTITWLADVATKTTASWQAGGGYDTWKTLRSGDTEYETVTGMDGSGNTTEYQIQLLKTVHTQHHYKDLGGNGSYTAHTKITHYVSPYWYGRPDDIPHEEGSNVLSLIRAERSLGFQSPHSIGSAGGQASAFSVASSFFIGYGSLSVGSPNSILTPVSSGVAQTSNSMYTFSIGTSECSVTALRTATALSDGATITRSTTTTFVEGISLASGNSTFAPVDRTSEVALFETDGRSLTVAGGAHAWTGGNQHLTINAYGVQYTLADAAGNTTYSTVFAGAGNTIDVGNKCVAVELLNYQLAMPLTSTGFWTPILCVYPH